MTDEPGGFKGLLIGFIIFGLFCFLVLTTIANISTEYNADTSNVLNGSLNIQKYEEYLENAKSTAEERKDEFRKQNPFSAVVEIVTSGIWFVSLGFLTVIFVPFDILGGVIYLIVGNNALANIITGTLLSTLIISVIFGIWRVLRQGD